MKDVKVAFNMMIDHSPICKIMFLHRGMLQLTGFCFFFDHLSMAVHKQRPQNTFSSLNIHKY